MLKKIKRKSSKGPNFLVEEVSLWALLIKTPTPPPPPPAVPFALYPSPLHFLLKSLPNLHLPFILFKSALLQQQYPFHKNLPPFSHSEKGIFIILVIISILLFTTIYFIFFLSIQSLLDLELQFTTIKNISLGFLFIIFQIKTSSFGL